MDLIVAFISYLLPIILFLIFCLKKASKGLWVIFFYLVLSFFVDFLIAASDFGHRNQNTITGIFTIAEFTMLAVFFYLSYSSLQLKRFILVATPIVLIILIVNFLRSNRTDFDSVSASIESIALIIFSIIYFFEEINKPQPYLIYSSPNFWIIIAILIYMSSTLFLFIIANNLSTQERDKYWIINKISSILTNIIFCIAFVRNKYAQSSPSLENPSF